MRQRRRVGGAGRDPLGHSAHEHDRTSDNGLDGVAIARGGVADVVLGGLTVIGNLLAVRGAGFAVRGAGFAHDLVRALPRILLDSGRADVCVGCSHRG